MKNIEKYKNQIINAYHADLSCCVHSDILHLPCNSNCRECKQSVVEWLLEEYSDPILDDVEKEYLSAVIKPFRKEVATISKFNSFDGSQYIYIGMKDRRGSNLPTFPKGTMYKGMIEGIHYSLKELGL